MVSCVATKRDRPAAASDLYISDWFRSARALVEARGGPWFIISAKYGLLKPTEQIEPYEMTLKGQPVAMRRAWAKRVTGQFVAEEPTARRIVLLAGYDYAQFLVPALREAGFSVERPMAHLRQGEQLSWLKRSA